ncbi:hypothetical protein ZWY2020_002086 [Hordeum vulgare]|nr:hypothetical protein ZWY2020_002086 [Hordeum vulgare]
MGPPRGRLALLLLALSAALAPGRAAATGVFEVRCKFPRHDGSGKHLANLRAHDARRHGRSLTATCCRLYFTQIGIGTPAKSYYVQVDTGSDILWVNCVFCDTCPRKSGLGIELTLYDPSGSSSGTGVTCGQDFCVATHGGYSISYGDGNSTTWFFVTAFLQYNQVSGNSQTTLANTSITFGCGSKIGGDLGSSSQALDGILGFGQSNSSMLSQLAAAGKVRPHYNVNLEAIDVGGVKLQLPTNIFDIGESKGTIIDSGTTLAYLPGVVYNAIMSKVFAQYGDMPLKNDQDFQCFRYSGSVDDGFPIITFHFEGGLPLNIHPHDYLFQNGELYCMGFQTGGLQTKDGKDMVLLGDLAFSNRLVLYDLENQVIGWTDYNCSSSIKIKDDKTGSIYTVDAHDISSGWRFQWHKSLFVLLVTALCSYTMF